MNLSDTQRIILSQASQRDDRLAVPPAHLPAGARQKVAAALIRQGLVSDEHASAYAARDAWQIDGRTRLLRITDAGLRAIGVAPEDADAGEEDEQRAEPIARRNAERRAAAEAGATGAETAPTGGAEEAPRDEDAPAPEATQAAPTPVPTPAPRASLRDAAAAVLAAWDDEANREADIIAALDGPMAALRNTLAGKPPRTVREPGAPRKPREGTKQETVLAMLRREEGATIAQICEATEWQQHTARGFLAALKKRGIEVAVLARVRHVGPGKEGARGSYSIYRAES